MWPLTLMYTQRQNALWILGIWGVMLLSLGCVQPGWTEGNINLGFGVFGENRVVRSTPGNIRFVAPHEDHLPLPITGLVEASDNQGPVGTIGASANVADLDPGTVWTAPSPTLATPRWLRYNGFTSPNHRVTNYTLRAGPDVMSAGRGPRAWLFQGTNDKSWTTGPFYTLDQQEDEEAWQPGEVRRYAFRSRGPNAAVAPTMFQYYRWVFTTGNSTDTLEIAEVQMDEQETTEANYAWTASVSDLAPRVFSVSTTFPSGTGQYKAANAADGKPSDITNAVTVWKSAAPPSVIAPQWLMYDAVNPIALTAYTLQVGANLQAAPKDWVFEASQNTGGIWVPLDGQTNVTGWTSATQHATYTFPNTTPYRYYRWRFTANNGDADGVEIAELRFATWKSPAAPTGIVPQSLVCDWMPIAHAVTNYTIQATDNVAAGPKSWMFQGTSTNPIGNPVWTTLDSRRNEPGWTVGETRRYAFYNPVAFRYYRWLITSNEGDTQTVEVARVQLDAGATQPTGYVAVSMTCEEPDFWVPDPTDPVTPHINNNSSSPSFYLGGGSPEVDAGIQYETGIPGVKLSGWRIFISSQNGWTNLASSLAGPAIRIDKTLLGTFSMTYSVLSDGGIDLQLHGAKLPPTGLRCHWSGTADGFNDGSISVIGFSFATANAKNTTLSTMNVKRVTALTQQSPNPNAVAGDHFHYMDGSYMLGSPGATTGQPPFTVSDVRLATPDRSRFDGSLLMGPAVTSQSRDVTGMVLAHPPSEFIYNWAAWSLEGTDQQRTGFDGRVAQDAGGVAGNRHWVVDCDYLGISALALRSPDDPVDPVGNYRVTIVPDRYLQETVKYDLRGHGSASTAIMRGDQPIHPLR